MHKPGLLTHVAAFAPGLLQIRRSTWIAVGLGLCVLLGLLIWAAVAAINGFLGMARNAPETARQTLKQVETVVPGARDRLAEMVPPLAPMVRGVLDRVEEIYPGARGKLNEIWQPTKPPPQAQPEGASNARLEPIPR